jgi:CRISPR-associated Cas5-like protein
MKSIVFDISGDWGHFRKPYAPVSPVTFPLPPPPSVLGMIGAICGYGKDEYAEKIGWDRVRIAITLKAPVKRYRTALNLVNTKGNKFFRLVGEASRSQIPYEFLKSPAFRIHVADASAETMADLERQHGLYRLPWFGAVHCQRLICRHLPDRTVAPRQDRGCVSNPASIGRSILCRWRTLHPVSNSTPDASR